VEKKTSTSEEGDGKRAELSIVHTWKGTGKTKQWSLWHVFKSLEKPKLQQEEDGASDLTHHPNEDRKKDDGARHGRKE